MLARGDRRALVVIDRAGDEHSLARRLGVKTAEMRARLADIDPASLPSVTEAKAQMRAPQPEKEIQREAEHKGRYDPLLETEQEVRQAEHKGRYDELRDAEPPPIIVRQFEAEAGRTAEPDPNPDRDAAEAEWLDQLVEASIARAAEQKGRQPADGRAGEGGAPERPAEHEEPALDPTVAKIRDALRVSDTPQGFLDALESRGLMMTYATAEEARQSERTAAFAKEIDRYARTLTEGELLVIDERGRLFRLNARTTGDEVRVVDGAALADGAEPWMRGTDGAPGLGEDQLASARRSYERWAENKPELAVRHGFEDYVQYVQGKWEDEPTPSDRRQLDLGTVDRSELLSVTAAKDVMRDVAREKARPATGIEAKIADALASTMTGYEFAETLDKAGLTITRVSASDVKALDSERSAAILAGLVDQLNDESSHPRHLARVEEGDLAAITRKGDVFRLNPHKLDFEEIDQRLLDTQPRLPGVMEARALHQLNRAQTAELWDRHQAFNLERSMARLEASGAVDAQRDAAHELKNSLHDAREDLADTGSKAVHAVGRGLMSAARAAFDFLESLFSPPVRLTKDQAERRELAAEESAQRSAQHEHETEQENRLSAINDQISEQNRERHQDFYTRFPGLTRRPDDPEPDRGRRVSPT